MKKGFWFLIIIAAAYWGIFYAGDHSGEKSDQSSAAGDGGSLEVRDSRLIHSANRQVLETTIEIFKQKEERYPYSLGELVQKEYISQIPDPGLTDWEYDSDTGELL